MATARTIMCFCRADEPQGHAHMTQDWDCPRQPVPNPAFGPDLVNLPPHYRSHPSGIECITITEGFNFCLGNVIKYVWRAGAKEGVDELEDLRKARWYLDREIARREAGS